MQVYPCCPNLRDLGGLPAAGGTSLRHGRLIRAGGLGTMDQETFAALGSVLAIYDLRSENERQYRPDPTFPGVQYHHIPLSENGRRQFMESKRTLADKVEDIHAGYRRGEPVAALRMRTVYAQILRSPGTARCLEGVIRTLAENREGAVLWHCEAGKDRTGVVAALLLRLLGVADEVIFRDYLYTNQALSHELDTAYGIAYAATGSRKAAEYVRSFFTACPCWLAAALDALDGSFGIAEKYLFACTDLKEDELRRFRESCLTKTTESVPAQEDPA